MRTLTKILKEADKCKTVKDLSLLSTELFDSRIDRERFKVSFGLEHIQALAEGINQQYELNEMMKE